MAFDVIVFNQKELEDAVQSGYGSVALCDGSFTLPLTDNIAYTAIGDVNASVYMSEAEFARSGIVCDGFSPVFLKADNPYLEIPATKKQSFSSMSSFFSSYFFTSYFMTSYRYLYEYEYEFKTSFSSSYITSYRTSYAMSYMSSYASSYTSSYVSSYASSYASSYVSSYASSYYAAHTDCDAPKKETAHEWIPVNGYGINLI